MLIDVITSIAAIYWTVFNGIGFAVIGAIETTEHIAEVLPQVLQGII